MDDLDADQQPPALGLVLDEDRASLPYALIHGEALCACAAWALGEAGVTLVDSRTTWVAVRDAGEPVVLHDALCPMTPPDFIASCVRRALAEDAVVVATRPVTDTIKVVADGLVAETVPRDGLTAVVSPVVLPPSVLAAVEAGPDVDLVSLVADLARTHRIVTLEAPASARRVGSQAEITILEALTAG